MFTSSPAVRSWSPGDPRIGKGIAAVSRAREPTY